MKQQNCRRCSKQIPLHAMRVVVFKETPPQEYEFFFCLPCEMHFRRFVNDKY